MEKLQILVSVKVNPNLERDGEAAMQAVACVVCGLEPAVKSALHTRLMGPTVPVLPITCPTVLELLALSNGPEASPACPPCC